MQSQSKAPGGPKQNRKRGLWVVVPAVVVCLSGLYVVTARPNSRRNKPSGAAEVAVRTVRARSGAVERMLRLTGVTAPERYASLLAPQLRGARHGMQSQMAGGGRHADSSSSTSQARGTAGAAASTTASTSSSGSTSSGTAQAGTGQSGTSASAQAGAPGGAASQMSSGANSSLATALSRFSTPKSGGGSSRQSSLAKSLASTSGTSLGSTASNLPGGGGGGGGGMGGGGDFNLVLQDAVPPGSRVKKGQVVAEFDRQYMLLRLDDFRATFSQAEAGLRTLQATLEVEKKAHDQSIGVAKGTLDKARYDLKTIPVQSDILAEQLKLAAEEADANYKQLLKNVKLQAASQAAEWRIAQLERQQNKIELTRVEANADRMLLKAPMDGITVMSTTFRGGEFGQIRPGDQVHGGEMFMRIVDPASMVINASVNQADIEQLRVGQKAKVRFDAYPELELPARVHAIGAMPKTGGFRANYVKEIPITLRLDRMDSRVIPDLSVSVDIVLGSEPEAVIAPLEAIFSDAPGAKPYVFVPRPAGFEKREIELGLTNNVVAAIRSGLKAGDAIAAERPPQETR